MRQRRVRLGAALAGLCAALIGPGARAAALQPDGVLANVVSAFDHTRSVLREYTPGGSQLQTWNIAYPGVQSGADITCVQVAGLIARRILCYVAPGAALRRGERYGFIRFGSRVDVYLPPGSTPLVAAGDKVAATSTVLASLPAA